MSTPAISENEVRHRLPDDRALGKATLRSCLVTFCIFGLIFDSGGELGLRSLAFALLSILWLFQLKSTAVTRVGFFTWFFVIASMTPAILSSITKEVAPTSILVWIFPVAIFPALHLISRSLEIKEENYINAGMYFSIIIITIFFGRIFDIPQIISIHEFISERSSGFFNEKKAFFEDAMPVVYFQGTLVLVICAVLSAGHRRIAPLIICCIALFVAPSRFGLIVSIMFSWATFLLMSKRRFLYISLSAVLFTALAISVNALPSGISELFSSDGDGAYTRLMHLDSVISLFNDKPWTLIFGDGPGTSFYSSGFQAFTDNIEISHLELIRKFGIVFFLLLNVCIFMALRQFVSSRRYGIAMAVCAHYCVALSNPVLLSIPAVLLFAAGLVKIHPRNNV